MWSPAVEKASAKMGRKGQRIKGLLDSCPGDNDLLIGGTCPFNVHHRDAPQHSLVDGLWTSRVRNASMNPCRWSSCSPASIDKVTSTASTSARSTSVSACMLHSPETSIPTANSIDA